MAAYFATSSDYLSAPPLWGADLARPPITFMCWVKPDSISAIERQLITYGGSVNPNRVMLGITTANPLFRINYDLSSASASAGNAQVAGEWSYICGALHNVASPHRCRMQQRSYQFTHAGDWNVSTGVNPWTAGQEFRVAGYTNSTVAIAHVAAWKCSLSHRQMDALYRGHVHPMDMRPDALLAYWPLRHKAGATFYEDEVYGIPLVARGTVTSVEDPPPPFPLPGSASTILVI